MTVIAMLISKEGTFVSTDSMLTYEFEPGKFQPIEFQQSKLIRLEKFRGTISFWGTAVEPVLPIRLGEFNWTLYDWLKETIGKVLAGDLESFTKELCDRIKVVYRNKGWLKKGIGLHISGYELINGRWIPEMFLISNFTDPSYRNIGDLQWSRQTFHTITNDTAYEKHGAEACREKVHQFLSENKYIIYNNGDPGAFDGAFSSLWQQYRRYQALKLTKSLDAKGLLALVRQPTEMVSNFQKLHLHTENILVGGRIHDLSVTPYGIYTSSSGD